MSPEAGSDLHCGWVAFTFKPGHINNSSNLLQSGKPEHHERQTGRQEADCTECLVMQLCGLSLLPYVVMCLLGSGKKLDWLLEWEELLVRWCKGQRLGHGLHAGHCQCERSLHPSLDLPVSPPLIDRVRVASEQSEQTRVVC